MIWWLNASAGLGQPVINELLINPPGTDAPNETVELRGTPNYVFPDGSYLLVVEGDTNANPGVIENIFELSKKSIGGNGFLVFLQKDYLYPVDGNAAYYANTESGSGWGSGSSSSLDHDGNAEFENGSQTFFLIQTTNRPSLGDDIDADDNGVPDSSDYSSWHIWDSIGLNDLEADIIYGAINFRRNANAITSGTVVNVTFEPKYLARLGNTTGSGTTDWLAGGDIDGTAPNFTLGRVADTFPQVFAGSALNHLGWPNFGAAEFPGVVVKETDDDTEVEEGSGIDVYTLALNTVPAGAVTLEINAPDPVQISINGGSTFGASRTITLTDTIATNVIVRAFDDNVIDTSPNVRFVTHTLISTLDPQNYPASMLTPIVTVEVEENDWLVLNELKVNPSGTEDAPFEFIELRGPPNARLANLYFLAIDGDLSGNPGQADVVIPLDQTTLGGSGLMVIVGPGHPYFIPSGTTVHLASQLGQPGGGLDNDSTTFMLVSSRENILQGGDLDAGDNGSLEGLPQEAAVLDSVAWRDGTPEDILFSEAALTQPSGTPDAATRFSFNLTANSSAAWFNGDLAIEAGASLIYDSANVSTNFPFGAILTPGIFANSPPSISPLAPYSSVIGDPTSPGILFYVNDAETDPTELEVTVESSHPAVVPEANLILQSGPGGRRHLQLNPVGVGYATLILTVDDGDEIGQTTLSYAASEMGRPGGRFHTGISDASSAMALDPNVMLAADDESQIIRLFSRNLSGAAIASYNFNPDLHLTDLYPNGTPREVDIEGSARVGDRIFWMGAHSHARNAESRTNRGRIFATDLAGSGTNTMLNFVGHYNYLKEDLIAWDANNMHGKGAHYYGLAASGAEGVDPKDTTGAGFNLEGLCMAPGSSNTAYLAFRAPLIPPENRTKALIIPVTNFTDAAISYGNPGTAKFGAPIELDLNYHAIRSIEGGSDGYVIVAGPPDVATGVFPKNFELYTWTGHPGDAPQLRAADMTRIIPEGIVELPPGPWQDNSQVQLISDNGVTMYYDDGLMAKQLPEVNFKKFRSDWITLGPVITPPPLIWSVTPTGDNLVITWKAVMGRTYRVQYKIDVNGQSWQDIPGDVVADQVLASKIVPIEASQQGFYRVHCLP